MRLKINIEQTYTATILCCIFLCLFLSACKKDNVDPDTNSNAQASLMIYFKGIVGAEEFVMNQIYTHNLGYPYRFETVKFYASNFTLTKENGDKLNLDTIVLIDFYNGHLNAGSAGELLCVDIPVTNYTQLDFTVGLDSSINHADPANYPPDHPLSTYQGTHWGWAGGYRFAQFEGKVDTSLSTTQTLNHSFVYHTGFVDLIREIELNTSFSMTDGQKTSLTVNVNLEKIFDNNGSTIDPKFDFFTHATGNDFPLAEKVANHFKNAFSVSN